MLRYASIPNFGLILETTGIKPIPQLHPKSLNESNNGGLLEGKRGR